VWVREHGAWPPSPGRGAGLRPSSPAAGHRRRHGGERGAAVGDGEGRVREALHGRENEEHEETLGTTMEVSHRGRRPLPEPRRNPSIVGDSGGLLNEPNAPRRSP
jgi:hypothetical protein